MTSTQPVALGGILQVLLIAIFGVVTAWYPLTDTQSNSVLALIAALSVAVSWWVNNKTTAAAKPEDADGTPLIRADNAQPTEAAAKAGRFVIKDQAVARGGSSDIPAAKWSK